MLGFKEEPVNNEAHDGRTNMANITGAYALHDGVNFGLTAYRHRNPLNRRDRKLAGSRVPIALKRTCSIMRRTCILLLCLELIDSVAAKFVFAGPLSFTVTSASS